MAVERSPIDLYDLDQEWTDEQKALGNLVRRFVDQEVLPDIAEWHEKGIVPRSFIEKVAPTESTVLVTGENGTGKELVVGALHAESPRRDGPLVEVNCAAIPTDLVESELFGHEKGAFTGADRLRIGKFEQAHGGTLFLDEIGDMGQQAQAKVLRAVEEGTIQRVGDEPKSE